MLESFQDEHPLTRSDELLCLKMLESIQDEHPRPLTWSENITSSAAIFVSAKFPRFREKNIKFCVQIQTTTSIFRDVQDWTPLQPGAVCIGTVLHVLQVHEKKVLIIKELIFEFPVDCLIVNSISINFFEH